MINKIILFVLVIFHSLLTLVPSCHSTTNIALGKSYSVSHKPNYHLSAPPSDKSSLTDGFYSKGYFWTQKSTVGWQGVKNLEILVDLEKISPVGSISFSSASGTNGNVFYPSNIAVFVGEDTEHLIYVGDLATGVSGKISTYETKRLILENIEKRGRFVLFEVVSKGAYVFCDEIEIHEGNRKSNETGTLSIESARSFTRNLVRLEMEKEILRQTVKNFKLFQTDDVSFHKRLSFIDQKIDDSKSFKELADKNEEILNFRREVLSKQFPRQRIVVEEVPPWSHLPALSNISGKFPADLTFVMQRNGHDHVALRITNPTSESQHYSPVLTGGGAGSPVFSFYEAVYVNTAALERVPDPLVLIKSPLILLPGESKIIFVSAVGVQAGTWKNLLSIRNGAYNTKIEVVSNVANQELPRKQVLNSVNWSYLDFPLIRNRMDQATKDLSEHRTNVLVVPPSALTLNLFDDEAGKVLKSYLMQHKKIDKILIFMGNKVAVSRYGGAIGGFLDENWKTGFHKWYSGLTRTIRDAGFKQEQIYLYPFDEMQGKDVEQFISFAKWVKQAIPEVKVYATLNSKDSLLALPYLSIAQIMNNDDLLNNVNPLRQEIWIYDCRGPAKSFSPYSYYRLMAWKAFLRDYKGIGFWAYADAGRGDNPGTAWDDFDGAYPDYAVTYEGENNSLNSSRRWESWRMGIEDYELLVEYSQKRGLQNAKSLAQSVFENPQDTTRADSARRKIIEELKN
jgi:hypothetical protein